MFLSENPKNGFIFVFLMCFDDISRRWYELAKPSVEESSSTGDYFNDAGQGEEEEKNFCIFVFLYFSGSTLLQQDIASRTSS